MKRSLMIIGFGFLFLSVMLHSCKKEEVPTVTTLAVTEITQTTALSGGDVLDDGGVQLISLGICWNTSPDPIISNNKTSESIESKSFTSNLTQLSPNTKYYVRAYATNSRGTGYGNQISFTTNQIATASLTTTIITEITSKTAISGGNILSENGSSITVRGICWGTSANPTTENNKTNDGSGVGSYISNISGLIPGTTYYVRSYALNSVGTSYGNELYFKTLADLPTITTAQISNIFQTTATGGGNITSDGGGSITTRGICWNTSQTPTISNYKTTDVPGIGVFSSAMTGLIANMTYYVRAYATNSAGTAYGNEISFTTIPLAVPTLTTSAATAITETTAIFGGNITHDGGTSVSSRGVCWSTNVNPTTFDNNAYASVLKIHAAGNLSFINGSNGNRGQYGGYWSISQTLSIEEARNLAINSTHSQIDINRKAEGYTIRCLRD